MSETIPQEANKIIEAKYSYRVAHGEYVAFSYESYNQSMYDRRIGAEFGYHLRDEEVAAKDKELAEAKKEIERLKGLLKYRDKHWHIVFYRATSQMTAREIHEFWEENWKRFATENNLLMPNEPKVQGSDTTGDAMKNSPFGK